MIRIRRLYAHNFKQLREVELFLPDTARVLVQGKNEAGKSTLFEAIFFALFGTALATESGGRGLDGLISYDTEKARVELDLACHDRMFKIVRTIVRDKANIWELDIQRDSQPPEEIRGNVAINKRLVAELGFDGDALLNTCFVEQKKLEKLEGMSKAKREESLAKLLNLDRMVELENEFKIRAEDRQDLERLKKRSELAQAQQELPQCEDELAGIETKLKLIELRRAVLGAAEEMRAVAQLEADICAGVAERDAAVHNAERVQALRDAMTSVKEARDAAERLAENARELDGLKTKRAEAQQAGERVGLLHARAQSLERLSRLVQRMDEIGRLTAASQDRATQLEKTLARHRELSERVTREEQSLARLQDQIHRYEIGEALGDWIGAELATVTRDEIDRPVREKQAERAQLTRRFRIQVYGLALLLAIFVGAAAVMRQFSIALVVLAAATLIAIAIRTTLLWRDLSHASEALGKVRGEAVARAAANETQIVRRQEAQKRLDSWGVRVPETVDLAQAERVAIAREVENKTKEDLAAEQAAARERLVNARAILGELAQQHSIVDETPSSLAQQGEELRRKEAKGEEILARWQPRVQMLARELAIAADAGEIQRDLYRTLAEEQELARRAGLVASIDEDMLRRAQLGQELVARERDAYTRACALADRDAGDWRVSWAADLYTAFGKQLRAEHDTLGGDGAIKRAREIEGKLGRRQGERETRARNLVGLIAQARELLTDLGQMDQLPAAPTMADLDDLAGRLHSVDWGDEAALQTQKGHFLGRVHSLQERQEQLERELGLAGETLDPAVCRTEYEEQARAARVRERGVEVLSLARRRIVQKVLPATMDFMRRILPALTQDRYHDAQLDDDSYKIQVWDERAGQGGAFKEKNIFSGGTKDQFSLALRLAFALATLPQERGTAPSFIFLDEPLGSFDEERAEALIYLLTEGEIARAFDQVFLISHVHIDERLFTHRVVLENGRVAFTDLPTG